MNLDQYFSHTTKANNNKKICVVPGTALSDYRNDICKEETGASGLEENNPIVSNYYKVIFWYSE